ncbi:hypothetical protein MKC66_21280 [[Clostridium] innocuum]|nr:hypothetical protein [[Clostridium] innocuum]
MRFDKERFFKDLQEKKPEVYGNDKVQELIGIVIDRHYKKVENDEIVYDDDLLLELYDMVPEMLVLCQDFGQLKYKNFQFLV